jgi:dipeptidyl aminopeptidase/acylaminoacyl peptidase
MSNRLCNHANNLPVNRRRHKRRSKLSAITSPAQQFFRRGALAPIVLALTLASSVSAAEAVRRNGLIAFVQGSRGHIWVVQPNGGHARRLTDQAGGDSLPAWSPEGTKIAFFRAANDPNDPMKAANLYVMNADGSGQERLTSTYATPGEPAWSPDGKKIAYVDAPDELHSASAIATINSDGTGRRILTSQDGGPSDPSWSPDGKTIAYIYANYPRDDLYLMNADGSDQRLLVSDPRIAERPIWSPDGKTIAFLGPPGPTSEAIYAVNADGTHLHRISKYRSVYGDFAWAPDETKFVYTGAASRGPKGSAWLHLMNVDGTHIRRVRHTGYVGQGLSWQPRLR